MSQIGDGYGSEFHLRRILAEDPGTLSSAVLGACGLPNASLEWLPFPRDSKSPSGDRELRGMEFVTERRDVLEAWKTWWPQSGRPPCWDAIGRLTYEDVTEWVLLEAKANHVEFCSPPTGAGDSSRRTIEDALKETKRYLGVHRAFRWTDTYYQYANRLASLYFLQIKMKEPARLVFLYFGGDAFPDQRPCPEGRREWEPLLSACHQTLGLPEEHALSARVHDVFLEV